MIEEILAAPGAAASAAVSDGQLREWIEARLRTAALRHEPFRHLVVDQIFPPEYFAALSAAWPPTAAFKRDRHGRKYDLVPRLDRDGADTRAGGYASLSADQRAIWNHLVFSVNRRIVGPLLLDLFADDIARRLELIRRAHAAGRITYSMARTADWQPVANVGRLMMRGPGYELRPHVDSMPYLLTVLHYFPEQDDRADGTVLYKAERPLDFDRCVESGSTEYFDAAGIACQEVARLPFARNTLVAFPNLTDAAHGAAAPDHGLRRLFHDHLSLKGDDEKV